MLTLQLFRSRPPKSGSELLTPTPIPEDIQTIADDNQEFISHWEFLCSSREMAESDMSNSCPILLLSLIPLPALQMNVQAHTNMICPHYYCMQKVQPNKCK